MTRLIVRAYIFATVVMILGTLGVLTILEAYLEDEDRRVTGQVLSSMVEMVKDHITAASDRQVALAELSKRFGFEIRIEPSQRTDWPQAIQRKIDAGEAVYVPGSVQDVAVAPFDGQLLVLGPLPRYKDPSVGDWAQMGLVVMVATAVAFLFFLMPVVLRMRRVEAAARRVAAGELGARIQARDVRGDALAEAFNMMAARTEAIISSQRELLQAVSHELRTPLQRFRFGLTFAEEADDEETRRNELDALTSELDEMDGLVDELLTYVRYDSDTPRLELESIEVRAWLERVVERHRSSSPALQFEIHGDDTHIEADEAALRRAVDNLLTNARRYATRIIRVSVASLETTASVIVEDDGVGIPPDQWTRILRPFVKLGPANVGTGLGLALVDRIAQAHGGGVRVDASPLGGARVTIQNLTVSIPKLD